MRRKLLLTALLSSFVLGACGVKGELKPAPPIFGSKDAPQSDDTGPEETDPNG